MQKLQTKHKERSTKVQTVAQALGNSDLPRLDTEWLLLRVLGKQESSYLYTHGDDSLSDEECRLLAELTRERLTGKPLAYIFGEWEFYGRRFYVDEHVLVPRPETEGLVERALKYIDTLTRRYRQERDIVVADVGTGSGCIAVTLALESRIKNIELSFLATDISPTALDIARRNAERYNVQDKIDFIESDMLNFLEDHDPSPAALAAGPPLPANPAGKIQGRKINIDLIVSNPPYVPSQELTRARHSPDTLGLKFEPRIALDGGPDGQKFIRKISDSGIPALVEGTGGSVRVFSTERVSI